MSMSARKNRHQRIDKRLGHKQARQATRQVLEADAPAKVARGRHWAPTIEQPPISDDAVVGGPRSKKKGCKRNKYGPHVIVPIVEDVTIPWWRRRYVNPYECKHCHKSFYRIPKRGAIIDSAVLNVMPTVITRTGDHWDTFNIKMRLLGLKCHCAECQTKEK